MGINLKTILRAGYRALADQSNLPGHHHRAAWALLCCRTAALGGRAEVCPQGHHRHIRYNSCRHRSCPRCARRDVDAWIDRQRERLLPTDHYHVVFTVPSELRLLWAWNPQEMADVLFGVARDTLFTLLGDVKFLGARPGVLMALHTWSRTLILHPHMHCLVTGGGVTPEGNWKPVRNGFLLPIRVVREVYRGKLLSAVETLLRAGKLELPRDWNFGKALQALKRSSRKTWNVRIQERYAHGTGVVTYLARYIRGGPVKPNRLLSFDGRSVTFRYGDHRRADARGRAPDSVMRLSLEEFTRRWFQHVPMPRQRVVRAFGLYHHALRPRLELCREQLSSQDTACHSQTSPERQQPTHRCPTCGSALVPEEEIPRLWPPLPISGLPPPPPESLS